MGIKKAGPVVTDNGNYFNFLKKIISNLHYMTGNFVIDAPFSESYYRDPKEVSSFNFLIIIMI